MQIIMQGLDSASDRGRQISFMRSEHVDRGTTGKITEEKIHGPF